MTNKTKIYLDTSVVSCLQVPETPERMADTLRLWEDIKNGMYDIFISDITIEGVKIISKTKLILADFTMAKIVTLS